MSMNKQNMLDHLANWQGIKKDVLKGDFSSMIKQVIIQGGDEIAIKNSEIESNVYQCDLEINEMIESLKREDEQITDSEVTKSGFD